MSSWNLTIIILCFTLGIFLFRREWIRSNRHWLWGRWIATGIAVAGLGGLGFVWKKPDTSQTVSPPGKPVMEGHNGNPAKGFLDIHWPLHLKSGRPLMVQGRYMNGAAVPVTIFLNGFSTPLDSVKIPAGKSEIFQLSTIPKQSGKALFQLEVNDRKKILETQPVPVSIQQSDSLNLLILSSYPDFENKFLDQWLTNNRIRVVQRTRISKDRFQKNFLNRPSVQFNLISEDLLKEFDLLISDAAALSSLSSGEQRAVRQEVNENGMGLLVRADSVRNNKSYYEGVFPCYRLDEKPSLQFLSFPGDSIRKLVYPGNIDLTGIRYQSGTKPLVTDQEGQIRVSSTMEGNGKIVFSTLNHTYEWSLSGNRLDYGLYWSWLMQQVVKQKKESLRWWQTEKFPRPGEPVHFIAETEAGNSVEPTIGTDSFYLKQGKNIPFEWTGIYWPAETGWQPAIHAAGQYSDWYVFERVDWTGFSISEKQETETPVKDDNTGKGLYFLLFLISGWCFLWIERKLSLI